MFTVRKGRVVRVLQKNAREESSPYKHWPYKHSVDWSKPLVHWWRKLWTAANQGYYSAKVTELVQKPQAEQGLGVWDWYYWLKWFTWAALWIATVNIVNASLAYNGRKR